MGLFRKKKITYFLHIYKTGGTTVNDMFWRNLRKDEFMNLYIPDGGIGLIDDVVNLYNGISIPEKVKVVYGHYAYGIHLENDIPYQYMSILRDPFERSVSMFYNFHRLDDVRKDKVINSYYDISGNKFSFENIDDFLGFSGLHNQQCMFLTGVSTFEIEKDPAYYAKMAIDNIEREFRYVGLNSNFDSSVRDIAKILKLKDLNYSNKNLGINKPHDILKNDELRFMVNEMSKADKMIYDYVMQRY